MQHAADVRDPPAGGGLPAWPVSVLVLVLTLALGATLLSRFQTDQQRLQRAEVVHLAKERAMILQRSVERMVAINHALAALVHQGNGQIVNFETAAKQSLEPRRTCDAIVKC